MHGLSRLGLLGLLGLLALTGGCVKRQTSRPGQVTQLGADKYERDAVRMSSEGVVFEPSPKAAIQYDRVRLTELAQELRRPAAVCFLERAINTMEPGIIDGEPGWLNVPEGQARFRTRIAVDGTVAGTDILESAFDDAEMEECLRGAINKLRFPPSQDAFTHQIDIFYWVSLGRFREAQSEDFATLLRKQQTQAGVAAKKCLIGRVQPGEYAVSGLNLFDRDGRTMVNRIERGALPEEIGSCVAAAFKTIRIHAEPDAFVRPAAPEVVFTVASDGSVSVADERWLELILLEETAAREAKKAELEGRPIGEDAVEPDVLELPPGSDAQVEPEPKEPEPKESEPKAPVPEKKEPAPGESEPKQPKEPAPKDPLQPGTKIDLSPRRPR